MHGIYCDGTFVPICSILYIRKDDVVFEVYGAEDFYAFSKKSKRVSFSWGITLELSNGKQLRFIRQSAYGFFNDASDVHYVRSLLEDKSKKLFTDFVAYLPDVANSYHQIEDFSKMNTMYKIKDCFTYDNKNHDKLTISSVDDILVEM